MAKNVVVIGTQWGGEETAPPRRVRGALARKAPRRRCFAHFPDWSER